MGLLGNGGQIFLIIHFFKQQGHTAAATDLGNANPPRSVRCAALLLANGGMN